MSAGVSELLNIKVESLDTNLKGGVTIVADKNASLQDVLELLHSHDIRSVPIVDKADNDRLLGLVDMVDVIAFIVRFIEECHGLPSGNRNLEWFTAQLKKSGQTVAQIAGLSQKNKLIPVMQGTALRDIMQIMVTNSLQRVPVLNPKTNHLENFVTQSSLIQYFAKNSAKLGKYADCTLSQLGFQPKRVISVKETDIAIDAFKLMSDNKITGVPIVDSEGAIITNLSSRDLRNTLMDANFFEKLQMPVERFVSDLKSKTFMHAHAETMYPKICCKFNNTFAEVLHKLAATKIHRIYVVDASERPVGVISIDDIVSKVFDLSKDNEYPLAIPEDEHKPNNNNKNDNNNNNNNLTDSLDLPRPRSSSNSHSKKKSVNFDVNTE